MNMPFVIRNINDGRYIITQPTQWTYDLKNASQFKSFQSANKAIQCTVFKFLKKENITMDELQVLRLETEDEKETTLVADTNLELNFDVATQQLYDLTSLMPDISIQELIKYFKQEEKKYDRLTQDLLHKIELEPICGVTALRITKRLKEVRKRRRRAKDATKILASMKELAELKYSFANRTYKNRELDKEGIDENV